MPEMIILESGFTPLLFKSCATLLTSTVDVGTIDLLGRFIKNRKPTAVKQGSRQSGDHSVWNERRSHG